MKTNEKKFDNHDKTKIFVVDKFEEKKSFAKNFYNKNMSNQSSYYMTNENLNYYELKNHDEIVVNFIAFVVIKSSTSRCQYYRKIFSFNNNFHRYIRFDCFVFIEKFVDKSILSNNIIAFCSSIDFIAHVLKFAIYFAKVNISFIDVTKKFIDAKFFANASTKFIFRFNVDFSSNIEIDYNFRD